MLSSKGIYVILHCSYPKSESYFCRSDVSRKEICLRKLIRDRKKFVVPTCCQDRLIGSYEVELSRVIVGETTWVFGKVGFRIQVISIDIYKKQVESI